MSASHTTIGAAERVLVFWVPDWPVHAFLREHAEDSRSASAEPGTHTEEEDAASAENREHRIAPLALLAQHRVVACSASARAEGVRTGLREREAQARVPDLAVHPHRPEVDERRFAPVLAALEQLVPGIEPRRPGLCALRVRGPARYYGGEEPAARALLARAAELGLPGSRVGIADGLFAAEQAARAATDVPGASSPSEGIRIVPPGGSSAFIAPLPVSRAAGGEFAETLQGLGIRTLGALAALPEASVRQRFGAEGVAAHRRARAAGPVHGAEVHPRDPAREWSAELALEPPVDTAEQLSFACISLAEDFIRGLAEAGLVCTALRVELTDDIGVRHEREWLHPRRFSAADTIGRIRWQASSIARDADRSGAGIAGVRITPTHTDRAAAHEPGLWNTEPDERVHHHLSRAQSRLGHAAVGTMHLSGGRMLADRQRFVPWSTAPARGRGTHGSSADPWPGAIPGPVPSRVFRQPIRATLTDSSGLAVGVDAEDLLTAPPVRLGIEGMILDPPVRHWSQPWAVRERWWEGRNERFRIQLQLEDGDAWLLVHESGRWFAEGRYD